MKTRNYVQKNLFKFNKPKVEVDRKKEARRLACRRAVSY
jgi:hypothetical protein